MGCSSINWLVESRESYKWWDVYHQLVIRISQASTVLNMTVHIKGSWLDGSKFLLTELDLKGTWLWNVIVVSRHIYTYVIVAKTCKTIALGPSFSKTTETMVDQLVILGSSKPPEQNRVPVVTNQTWCWCWKVRDLSVSLYGGFHTWG